jgi:drug/metabolite transporter (DMT)-like permease
MSKPAGLIQIHAATLLMGLTGLFGKFLDVSPFVITGGRTIVGSLALLMAAKVMREDLRVRGARDWWFFAVSGGLLAIHWLTFFRAIQVSTVAIGLLAFSCFPLFVTFLEPVMFRERLRGVDILMAVAVVAGLAIVTPSFDAGDRMTQGVMWGVGSGFAYAILCLLSRSHVATRPAMTITFYQQGFAALFTAPGLWISRAALTGRTLLLLVILGLAFTALAQWLFVASLRQIRAQTASVVTCLEPVYGILFAVLLLGEKPSARTLLGGLLICGAVMGATLAHLRRTRARRANDETRMTNDDAPVPPLP